MDKSFSSFMIRLSFNNFGGGIMPSILQSVITDPTEPAVNITFLLDVSGSMYGEPINQ